MKKLLFFIPSLTHGGAERVMTNLANEFYRNGYEVVFLLYFHVEDEYYVNPAIRKIYLKKIESNNRAVYNIKLIHSIRRTIKKENPDVALSFLDRPNLLFLLSTFGIKKIKRFSSIRSDPDFEFFSKERKLLARILLPTANGVILQTNQSIEWFNSRRIKINYKVIPNQVAEVFFEKGLPKKRKNIVTSGRLVKCKNHEMLIRAFSKTAGSTDENLIIYGVGELKESLTELVNELGLNERVVLFGLSENIADEINNAKLFVLSSDFEGMPNALLEALALGIPSISTDCPCGGPGEIIEDGRNGFLVPVGDVDALAEKMKYVLSLPDDEIDKISNNAKTSSEKYRPEAVFKQWESFLIG